MRTLPENSVDSIVTDPPYHLTTGKKGGSGEASVRLDSPHGRARIGTGFMGMKWDGGDVAFRPETWATVATTTITTKTTFVKTWLATTITTSESTSVTSALEISHIIFLY